MKQMRNRALYILFFLVFTSKTVLGQEGIKFGVLFEPTIIWLHSDVSDVIPENPRLGFNFGMQLDYYFAQNYAFATGLSLFNTGGTLNHANGITRFRVKGGNVAIAPNSKIQYNVQYAKIPVALKFKTHRIGRMVYSANMGFSPMVRTTAKAIFEDDNKEKYNKVNVNNEINL